ncbi:glycosyltransferase family 4 protein [Telmatobacter sp. DSM 110680]|uniref:Glycosyltransferase family 4 protein n=1 Tax=Telmatobacter sp. DSM 110680 TaxID=3036704 RepID=A0AAU7DF80_9BACT
MTRNSSGHAPARQGMDFRVCLSSIGRFHFFSLAVELARVGVLEKIYTGYPSILARRAGIPAHCICSFPWLVAPAMAAPGWVWPTDGVMDAYHNLSHDLHDRWVASKLSECEIFHGLSRYNLRAGIQAKKLGAIYICEVGSSHIQEQIEIGEREHARFGLRGRGFHPRGVERELKEYETADRIIVLSNFALNSFIKRGVPRSKLSVLPPGVNLLRFQSRQFAPKGVFRVLFVGQVTIRKGVHVLAEAFKKANLDKSELIVAGGISPGVKAIIDSFGLENVRFLGPVPNSKLPELYQSASVFVLPSFEDGFGMVALEAMASGCPVIVSSNAGAADMVSEGVNGFVFPSGDVEALTDCIQRLYRDPSLAEKMGIEAAEQARRANTWEQYGDRMATIYRSFLDVRGNPG